MIIKQVPMTPLGPSGLPHDLERFRPVEREEVKDCYIEILFTNSKYSRAPCNAINVLLQVQVAASPRIEMPVMLRASPMDRAGLHTWLATRKAEADKKREEEVSFIFIIFVSSSLSSTQVAAASNPWLAKSYKPAQAEKKKEEVGKVSQSSSRLPSPVCEELASSVQGNLKEKLRQDLLKAWSGGEKVEPKSVAEPSVAVATMSSRTLGDFAPVSLEKIHPMGRMRAEMQAAATQRTWLATGTARPDGKVQRNEEECSKKEEIKETKALALRKSLLSAWGGQKAEAEVTKKMDEVSLSTPAAPNFSSTVNVDKPTVTPVGCGRPLLAAWTSGQCPIKESSMKESKSCLLSSWTSAASSLEIVENPDANNSMDDAASEASIVTLDTITDDSDDFDDFSDMKHELCQWISQ